MSVLTSGALALVCMYLLLIGRHVGFGRPDVLFVIIHAVTTIGTITQVNTMDASEGRYASLLTWSLVIFVLGSSVTHVVLRTRAISSITIHDSAKFGGGTTAFLVLGMLVVVVYFVAVGYSALIVGFQSAISGSVNDVATYRLESYAGSRYLFPGYVNQFKNALVPTLIALMIINWRRAGVRSRTALSVALLLFGAFSLLGTAQRTAAVLFVLVLLLILWQLDRRRSRFQAFMVLIMATPFLLLSTFALGRQAQPSGSPSLRDLVIQLVGRMLGGDAEVELRGFRYIESLPVASGSEWWASFVGLLPGQPGSALPNDIFELSYGSSRGNSQPSLWASALHNFGESGVFIFALFLGIAFAALSSYLNRTTVRNLYEVGGIAGLTVVLATWTVGSPVVPLNQGLPAYIALVLIGSFIRKRAGKTPAEGGRTEIGRAV